MATPPIAYPPSTPPKPRFWAAGTTRWMAALPAASSRLKARVPRHAVLLFAGTLLLSLGAASRTVSPTSPEPIAAVPQAADVPRAESTFRPRATWNRIAPPPAAEYPYKALIAEMATKYGLSPELVAGVVYIESNFDKNSVSSAGAIGLMQLMPATARPLAKKLGLGEPDLTDPRTNLELGCYFLRILMDKYDNHLPTVLSYYNGGRWGIVSRGVYRNRRYIRKVMDSYWRYAQPVSNGFSTARDAGGGD